MVPTNRRDILLKKTNRRATTRNKKTGQPVTIDPRDLTLRVPGRLRDTFLLWLLSTTLQTRTDIDIYPSNSQQREVLNLLEEFLTQNGKEITE